MADEKVVLDPIWESLHKPDEEEVKTLWPDHVGELLVPVGLPTTIQINGVPYSGKMWLPEKLGAHLLNMAAHYAKSPSTIP